MGITSGPDPSGYWWDPLSFWTGLMLPWQISNVVAGINLYRKAGKRKIALGLTFISAVWCLWLVDWIFLNKSSATRMDRNLGRRVLNNYGHWLWINLAIIFCFPGFTVINVWRVRSLLKDYQPFIWFITLCGVLSIATNTSAAIAYASLPFVRIASGEAWYFELRGFCNLWQGFSLVADMVLNCVINLAFVWYLLKVNNRGGSSMRPGLKTLLRRTIFELLFEVVFAVTSNVLYALDLDPVSALSVVTEGFRIRIMINFIRCLHETFQARGAVSHENSQAGGDGSSFRGFINRAISGRKRTSSNNSQATDGERSRTTSNANAAASRPRTLSGQPAAVQ